MAFESLSQRLCGVFKRLRGKGKLTEADIKAAMREVRMALLEADVNYKVAKSFIAQVTERAMGQEVMESLTPAQQVIKIVNEELTTLMGGEEAARIHIKSKPPTVIMLCGLQGNGKTTHCGKAGQVVFEGRAPAAAGGLRRLPPRGHRSAAGGGQAGGRAGVHHGHRKARGHRQKGRWPTPRTTATTSSFWIPPAVCMWTKP